MNELIAAFTTDATARLTGASVQLINRWCREGLLTPRYADESAWLGVKHLFSFRDIVALRTLLILRDTYEVRTKGLRECNDFLQKHYEDPWTTLIFYVLDHELLYQEPSEAEIVSASRPGQRVLPVPLEPIIANLSVEVRKHMERQPGQIGKITSRRQIMGGQACIDGTRITARGVWEYHHAGYSAEDIRREYPDLHPEDIAAAISFETSRKGTTKQPRSA